MVYPITTRSNLFNWDTELTSSLPAIKLACHPREDGDPVYNYL